MEQEIIEKLKPIKETFQCTICCHSLTCPTQIQCGHILCGECVRSILRLGKAEWKCPNCRALLLRRGKIIREDISELDVAIQNLEQVLIAECSNFSKPRSGSKIKMNSNSSAYSVKRGNVGESESVSETLFTEILQNTKAVSQKSKSASSPTEVEVELVGHDAQAQSYSGCSSNRGTGTGGNETLRRPTMSPVLTILTSQNWVPCLEEAESSCSDRGGTYTVGKKSLKEMSRIKTQISQKSAPSSPAPVGQESQSQSPLTQSQPLDLTVTTTKQADPLRLHRIKFGVQFEKPLDLSTRKRNRDAFVNSDIDGDDAEDDKKCSNDLGADQHKRQKTSTHESGDEDFQVNEVNLKADETEDDEEEERTLTPTSKDNSILPPGGDPVRDATTSDRDDGLFESEVIDSDLQREMERQEAEKEKAAGGLTLAGMEDDSLICEDTKDKLPIDSEGLNKNKIGWDEDASDSECSVFEATPVKPVEKVGLREQLRSNSGHVKLSDKENFKPQRPLTPALVTSDPSENSSSMFASPLPPFATLVDAQNLPGSAVGTNKTQSKKFVFCPSRLNRHEVDKLSDLCALCEGTISKEYTGEVTHIVLQLEKDRVPQTMKYLFAIADKKWVVVYDWVSECLKQGEMLFEGPFETSSPECDSGVTRSKVNPDQLLKGVHFYFAIPIKSSGASMDDCKELVRKMGGTIVESAYSMGPGQTVMLIGEGMQHRHVYQGWYKSKGWLSISWTWILDCLLTNNIVPFRKEHLLTSLDGSSQIRLPEPLMSVNQSSPFSLSL